MGIDNWLKVVIIGGFFLNAIYTKGGLAKDRRDQLILVAAMAFTLLADTFILLLDMSAFGVLAFCVVQTLYNFRYTNKSRVMVQVFLAVITFAIASLAGAGVLIALGFAYAVSLLFSVTGAFMAYHKYSAPNNLMIVIGMVLFMMCDIFVAIYHTQTGLGYEARALVFRAIWIFYFPSQALLSSSARKAINHKDE